MIHPSYTELIEKINAGVEPGDEPIVQSRYSIVIAAAKRARQIIAGEEATNSHSPIVTKPLSQAVAELDEGAIHIMTEEEFEAEKKRIEEEKAKEKEELVGVSEYGDDDDNADETESDDDDSDDDNLDEAEEADSQEEEN